MPPTRNWFTIAAVLEMARVERAVVHAHRRPGRPLAERAALARAFVAKAMFNLPTTRRLIERLQGDGTLRRLCGWSRLGEVPSEATFSRAFSPSSQRAKCLRACTKR